jgi:hypothetical protein
MSFVPRYRIDLKTVPPQYQCEQLLRVGPESPVGLRNEVERLANYFRREFGYDFMHSADSCGPYTAYLFSNHSFSPVWTGVCLFTPWPYERPRLPGVEELAWVWFHPYFRAQGYLSENWPTFRHAHGDFFVQRPYSAAMRGFLLKHNRDSKWLHVFEGQKPDWSMIEAGVKGTKAEMNPPTVLGSGLASQNTDQMNRG